MLLFITSEVMFFAGLFAAYFSIRAGFTESSAVGSSRVAADASHMLSPAAVHDRAGRR